MCNSRDRVIGGMEASLCFLLGHSQEWSQDRGVLRLGLPSGAVRVERNRGLPLTVSTDWAGVFVNHLGSESPSPS